MNRTLRRPMFRMGGSTGEGITSGLQAPRQNYELGKSVCPATDGANLLVSSGAAVAAVNCVA